MAARPLTHEFEDARDKEARPETRVVPPALSGQQNTILQLQKSAGNAAVARLLRSQRPLPRTESSLAIQRCPECGGMCGCHEDEEEDLQQEELLRRRSRIARRAVMSAPVIARRVIRPPGASEASTARFETAYPNESNALADSTQSVEPRFLEGSSGPMAADRALPLFGVGRPRATSHHGEPAEQEAEHIARTPIGSPRVPSSPRLLQRFLSQPNCNPYLDALTSADLQASTLVQNAIACLTMSPRPAWVDKALSDYFSISSSNQNKDDLVAAILGVYSQLSSHFTAGDYDYDCSCSPLCPSNAIGCTVPGDGPIQLCLDNPPPSFGGLTSAGPGVIVHEMSHRFAGTDDLSYCPGTCAGLSSDQAIGNAESYSLFAVEASFANPPDVSPSP
jgi:hypothetical protein